MAKIYTKDELQALLDKNANAETQQEAKAAAEQETRFTNSW